MNIWIMNLLFLLGLILFVFLLLLVWMKDEYSKCYKCIVILSIIDSVLVFSVIIFSIIGNYNCNNASWTSEKKPYAVEYIASMNDNNMSSGKFYLHSGYIEDQLYYQYMVVRNDGGFDYGKLDASKSTIYYSKDNFRVEYYKTERSWLCFKDTSEQYHFYVPEGNIDTGYNNDLK